MPSKVTIKLLPMNCLWSPWSDWSTCSAECGEGEMVRERSVVLPAKNGGGTFSVDSDGRGPPLVTVVMVVMVRRSSVVLPKDID